LIAITTVLAIRHTLHVLFYYTIYPVSGQLLRSPMINPEGIIWEAFLPIIAYCVAAGSVVLIVLDRLFPRWTAVGLAMAMIAINMIGMSTALDNARMLEQNMPNVMIAKPLTDELRTRIGERSDTSTILVNDSGIFDSRIMNGLRFFDIDDKLNDVEVIAMNPAGITGSDFLLTREPFPDTPDVLFSSGDKQYGLFDLSDLTRAQSLSEALYMRDNPETSS